MPVSGTVTADDFASGSIAALAGGTTTLIDFATQDRGDTLAHTLEIWHGRADGKCSCDYGFHMAITDWNERTRAELHDMAAARTFYEACQSILSYEYAIYMEQNASSYNLGRLDQYLYPYYKADKAAGILTDDGAQELLDCLWIKVAEMSLFQDEVTAQYAAGYCITVQTSCGGIDQYGNDATNELSYMMIQATMDVKFKEPNLSVTYSMSKNPDSLLHKACEAIGMGLTMPAIYCNDVGIRMMQNKGSTARASSAERSI